MKREKFILTIKAEDRPGLLHLLTGVLNRKLVPIISLTAAPTDIHAIVLVTLEIELSEKALPPLLAKLENIIEVYSTEAIPADKAMTTRSAFFKMDRFFMESPKLWLLEKYQATIICNHEDTVIVNKAGSEMVIRELYNQLEGPYLLGFSQTGLIADSTLIGEDESSVINRLAA